MRAERGSVQMLFCGLVAFGPAGFVSAVFESACREELGVLVWVTAQHSRPWSVPLFVREGVVVQAGGSTRHMSCFKLCLEGCVVLQGYSSCIICMQKHCFVGFAG